MAAANIPPDFSDELSIGKPSRGISRLNVFMAILLAALITVFYVSNVISIDSLLEENQQLKKKYTLLKNKNELLRTRINELQSADRIIKIAMDELGMVKPEKIPDELPR